MSPTPMPQHHACFKRRARGDPYEGDHARLAADTGPVRFLAELLASDADAVIRAFILIIVIILDPVAAVLLVAAGIRKAPA
jgi:hypothetical protein